ncbi:MAG: thioredoxin-disulfide reductase [Nitrospinota bacterium]
MYDLVIIGGGPGGISAAIYALRAKLKVLLIEKMGIGGQIALTDIIENYPGSRSLSGPELMKNFEEHAKAFGMETKFAEVEEIASTPQKKTVTTTSSEKIECRAVIIASGASPKKLNIKGEEEFSGRGVSYCATCDGPFYNNKTVVVIGGGDTAVKEAIFLSKIAKKVHLVHRRDRLRAEKIMQDMLLVNPKVEFHWNSTAQEITGDQSGVTGINIKSISEKVETHIDTDGVFIFTGIFPTTDFIDVKKDDSGFIAVNQKMETSEPGVYAIGDVRITPLRQVATAVGDGAIAAVVAEEYIAHLAGTEYPSRT